VEMHNPKSMIIEVENLSFSYIKSGPLVIDGLSAVFGPGRLNIIIGPNGSGKSTLARIAIGYLRNYNGTVKLNGDDIRHLTVLETARRVAFVPQENPISAPLTVREAVELGRFCQLAGGVYPSKEDKDVVEWAIELTGVRELIEKRVDNISGGEKQRVMIARVLAQGAGNLVLDEPTANLDLKYQPLIFDLLRRLVEKEGYNVTAITHDVNLASRYADMVFLLKAGKIFARGLPGEVVNLGILESAYETKLKIVGGSFFIPLGAGIEGGGS